MILKNKIHVAVIFLILTKLLLFIFLYDFKPIYGEDTYTYMSAAQKLLTFKIDDYRTPGFPIFLGIFKLIFGKYFDFVIVFFNILFSSITLIVIYRILNQLELHKYFIIIYLFFELSYTKYDYYLLTESLCKNLIIIYLYHVILNKKTFHWQGLLIMIKPIFIILIFFDTLYNGLLRNYKFIIYNSLVIGFVFCYSLFFKFNFGYYGISKVNDYNKFSQIIHFNLSNNSNYPLFNKRIHQYISNNDNQNNIRNYETIGLNKVFKTDSEFKYAYNNLHNFVNSTLGSNYWKFNKLQLLKMIDYLPQNYILFGKYISFFHLLIFNIIFLILVFFKNSNINNYQLNITISIFLVLVIFAIVWGSGNEYIRLFMPFYPFLFISMCVFGKMFKLKINSN